MPAWLLGKLKTTTTGPSPQDEELLSDAKRRCRKLPAMELLNWADAAGSGMAKGFDDFRQHGELESLADIGLGLITLQAVVYELTERKKAELHGGLTG
jgi:hypothetical protein